MFDDEQRRVSIKLISDRDRLGPASPRPRGIPPRRGGEHGCGDPRGDRPPDYSSSFTRTDRTPASQAGSSVGAPVPRGARIRGPRRRAAAPARGRRRKRRGGRTGGNVERGIRVDAKPKRTVFALVYLERGHRSRAGVKRERRSRYSHGERAPSSRCCGHGGRFLFVLGLAVDMAVMVSNPAQPLRDRAIPNPTPSPL